jgi:hypothetical protein
MPALAAVNLSEQACVEFLLQPEHQLGALQDSVGCRKYRSYVKRAPQ